MFNTMIKIWFSGPQDEDDLSFSRETIAMCNNPNIAFTNEDIKITSSDINVQYKRSTITEIRIYKVHGQA